MPNDINERVAVVSRALEDFCLTLRPGPTVETLAAVFVHWAARAALMFGASKNEFLNGADVAWDAAVEDFKAAVPYKG